MELVSNIVIASLLLSQIALATACIWVVRGKIRDLEGTIRAFMVPKGPEEASPLANCVDAAADMVARAVMARAKTTFMGQASGEVRAAKAVDGAMAEDLARAAHPLAGTLLDSMPELRKTLRKNPGLLDYALSKLAGKAASSPEAQLALTPTPQSNNGSGGGKING